jgi:hypothetical protein
MRTGAEEFGHQGRRFDDLLEVVENQQHRSVAQKQYELRFRRRFGGRDQSQLLDDR